MRNSPPDWQLEGFLDRLDAWIERESPNDDLCLLVTAWIMTRYGDPYQGVRRESGFPNLWFGAVPDTEDGSGNIVVCAYWIEESNRVVRCDSFATLGLPL
ncbi:MAG TPA: hypothetical protein VMU51_34700 [Mycobacteriales bacterium]|nr:hypothetical protein [Mycobacteriales bacterium]